MKEVYACFNCVHLCKTKVLYKLVAHNSQKDDLCIERLCNIFIEFKDNFIGVTQVKIMGNS